MLDLLKTYKPSPDEENHLKDIRALIEKCGHDCYYRTHFNPGHITGSGLLISADGKRVLLNHHKFLNKWLSFGGHADGEQDIFNVALREVIEESGIENVEPVMADIFDVDVHPIPENNSKKEPAHHHFDIRYLFRVSAPEFEDFTLSDESLSLKWHSLEESLLAVKSQSMRRLLYKWSKAV